VLVVLGGCTAYGSGMVRVATDVLALNGQTWNSVIARQFRLGMGVIGSIPTWFCFFLAFVVLVIVRSASLVLGGLFSDLDRRLIVAAQDGSHKIDSAVLNKPLGTTKPAGRNQRTEGGGFMNSVRRTVSVVFGDGVGGWWEYPGWRTIPDLS
jgi:hypothetical protein